MYIHDDEISLGEISDAEKELKEDKVSGDGWVKKMITFSLLLFVQLMYNTILKLSDGMEDDDCQRNIHK